MTVTTFRALVVAFVIPVAMLPCRSVSIEPHIPPTSARATPSNADLVEVFRDFDYLGVRPITYKNISDSKHSYPLADWGPIPQQANPQPFPASPQSGARYFLRNGNLQADLFYRELEKRFQARHFKTSLFMPHSVMAVVYDPPIPVRFLDKPPLVLQPMSLVFHGNGYEGLVILDEALQVSDKRPRPKTSVHDYSLVILKAPT